jgi:hypothetical protein|tara:strand:+ start:674 stop:982 length:309 start_codon:yes stop_codon:yes gene_type:complete
MNKKKKFKIKKAIYGKKEFISMIELDYYKRYEMLKLDKELVDDVHVAIGKAEGYIPCKTLHEEIIAWQYLIDTGIVWKLQGRFGIQAMFLIDQGLCTKRVVH